MKLWTEFFDLIGVKYEAFQPTDESRERDAAQAPSLEALPIADGHAAQLDSAGVAQGEARATARVYLIRSPRVRLYDLAIYFKSRGYRLKQDGRGYIEAVR